jgi:tRNA (guanine26-N2/guanine27-N2)-dimethyltransferase
VPEQCGNCGDRLAIGGPIWHEPIHNLDFVKAMYETCKGEEGKKFGTIGRIKGILGSIIDESILSDQALSYDFSQVCSNLKSMNPTLREITAGFSSLEYRIAQTYYEPTLWKTDAPPEVVYEIFKAYKMMQSEGNEEEFLKNVHPSSSMHTCMKKPITVKPDFNTENLKDKKKLGKYFVALEANWGPKPRATGGKKASKPEESKD